MTIKTEEAAVESELRKLLAPVAVKAQTYFTHLAGQAIAWYTVAEHDLTKVESGLAVGGSLVLTAAIARVKSWLAKA